MSKLVSNYAKMPNNLVLIDMPLTSFKVMLYFVIWQNADVIYVSQDRIALECHLSKRTVERAIKYLKKEKFISVISGKKDRRTNIYKINFEQIDSKCIFTAKENELRDIQSNIDKFNYKKLHLVKTTDLEETESA